MQTKFEKGPHQEWSLVGIAALHRAIIRRTVLSQLERMPAVLEIKWTVTEIASSALPEVQNAWSKERMPTRICPEPRSVELLSRDRFLKILRENENGYRPKACPSSASRIRLLWDWSSRGMWDLRWCTELGFAGVVYDVTTLEAWVRIALNKAPTCTSDSHAFTAGITLPQL